MKVHILSNSLRMNSGFSIVAKNLAIGLKKLGYQVSFTGMQTAYLPEYDYGIEQLPIQVGHIDDMTQYMITLDRIKPDVVLNIFQADYEYNDFPKVFKKCLWYVPVEGKNIPQTMANDLLSVKINGGDVVAQTKYGQGEIQLALGGIDIPYIYHGFDDKIFKPIDLNKREEMTYCYYKTESGKANSDPIILHKFGCYDCQLNNKEQPTCPHYKEEYIGVLKFINGKWTEENMPITKLPMVTKGKHVFLFVGQNLGIRKRIERLLKAYYLFIKDSKQLRDRTVLHLHSMPISISGVNLIKTIQDLGLQDNIVFSYGSYRSSGWSNEAINVLYNTADVNVSASSSEGFCVLPDSPILTLDRGVQKIKDIKIGDNILTHKGRFMRVNNVMNRQYKGDIIKIIPYGLRIPLALTPEHRVLAVKTVLCEGFINRYNDYNSRICRPGLQCYHRNNVGNTKKMCKYIEGYEPYRKYRIQWFQAKDLEIGDFVVYPKSNKEIDKEEIKILDYMMEDIDELDIKDYSGQTDLFGELINELTTSNPNPEVNVRIPSKIKLTGDVMRLFGYFIAEGHIYDNEIGFTFNANEKEYINDVEKIMYDTFGLTCGHQIINNGDHLRYQNKILAQMLKDMFAPNHNNRKGPGRKAHIVKIPKEFLDLPKRKLSELIKGYWRGDGSNSEHISGNIKTYSMGTTSENLAHQIIYVLSKFNILPSIYKDKENIDKNKHENYQIIIQGRDVALFNEIIEEEHNLNKEELIKSSQYIKGKNHFFIPIKNINTTEYDGTVCNLEVEEDNSYISPIAVHNCLPVLEGFATGVPMIAPNCSSFIELIGDGDKDPDNSRGLLANIGEWQMIENGSERALVNEQHLSTMMKKMYQNEDLRKTFSKNAIKFAQNYTWEKIVKKWDQLLKNM